MAWQEVVLSTARLVAGWQAVGFTHGVRLFFPFISASLDR